MTTRRAPSWIGITFVLATPFLLWLGVASAGAGHGDYILAMVLFPYSVFPLLLDRPIPIWLMVVAVLQFPAYGFALSRASRYGRLRLLSVSLLVVHAIAATVCLRINYVDTHRKPIVIEAWQEDP